MTEMLPDEKLERIAYGWLRDRCEQAERERERLQAELNETFTDDAGTTWRRPSAWAYAQVCKVVNERQLTAEKERDAALAQVEQLREALNAIASRGRLVHREDDQEVCYDWCPACKLAEALSTPPSDWLAERRSGARRSRRARKIADAIRREFGAANSAGFLGFARRREFGADRKEEG